MECWRDLQQRLTVRNSVVYINRNLFHSLPEPGEPRVSKGSISVYMSVRMCASPGVCLPAASIRACVRADASAYARTPSWTRLAVYSAHCEARRCLQQRIYAAPRFGQLWRLRDLQQGSSTPAAPLFSLRPLKVTVGGAQSHGCSRRDRVLLSSPLVFTSTSDTRAAVQPPGRSSHPHEEATLRDLLALIPPLPLASSLCLRKNWGLFKSRRPVGGLRAQGCGFGFGPGPHLGRKTLSYLPPFFPTLTMKRW